MEFSGGGRTRPTWMPARLPCESRTWVVLGLFCRHRRRRLGIRGPLTFRSSRDHAVSIPTSYSSHPPDPLFFFPLFLPIDSPTPLVPYYQQALALLISVDRFDCVLHLFSSARFTSTPCFLPFSFRSQCSAVYRVRHRPLPSGLPNTPTFFCARIFMRHLAD